jgi:hypothetical protein
MALFHFLHLSPPLRSFPPSSPPFILRTSTSEHPHSAAFGYRSCDAIQKSAGRSKPALSAGLLLPYRSHTVFKLDQCAPSSQTRRTRGSVGRERIHHHMGRWEELTDQLISGNPWAVEIVCTSTPVAFLKGSPGHIRYSLDRMPKVDNGTSSKDFILVHHEGIHIT